MSSIHPTVFCVVPHLLEIPDTYFVLTAESELTASCAGIFPTSWCDTVSFMGGHMTGSCNAHTLEQVKHPTYRLSRVWKGVTRKEWMDGGREGGRYWGWPGS